MWVSDPWLFLYLRHVVKKNCETGLFCRNNNSSNRYPLPTTISRFMSETLGSAFTWCCHEGVARWCKTTSRSREFSLLHRRTFTNKCIVFFHRTSDGVSNGGSHGVHVFILAFRLIVLYEIFLRCSHGIVSYIYPHVVVVFWTNVDRLLFFSHGAFGFWSNASPKVLREENWTKSTDRSKTRGRWESFREAISQNIPESLPSWELTYPESYPVISVHFESMIFQTSPGGIC